MKATRKTPRRTTPAVERFWPKVAKGGPGECWEWVAARTTAGYGSFYDGRVVVNAHRYSWELANGPIPPGAFVCHSCDNRGCVNPSHLWLGTAADNSQDMVSKRRGVMPPVRGESNARAKLTEDDVRAIRNSPIAGRALARMYGVTEQAVSQARRRKTWTHVD